VAPQKFSNFEEALHGTGVRKLRILLSPPPPPQWYVEWNLTDLACMQVAGRVCHQCREEVYSRLSPHSTPYTRHIFAGLAIRSFACVLGCLFSFKRCLGLGQSPLKRFVMWCFTAERGLGLECFDIIPAGQST